MRIRMARRTRRDDECTMEKQLFTQGLKIKFTIFKQWATHKPLLSFTFPRNLNCKFTMFKYYAPRNRRQQSAVCKQWAT